MRSGPWAGDKNGRLGDDQQPDHHTERRIQSYQQRVDHQLGTAVRRSAISNRRSALSRQTKQSTLSDLQDTDIAAATTKLTQAQTAFEAALKVTGYPHQPQPGFVPFKHFHSLESRAVQAARLHLLSAHSSKVVTASCAQAEATEKSGEVTSPGPPSPRKIWPRASCARPSARRWRRSPASAGQPPPAPYRAGSWSGHGELRGGAPSQKIGRELEASDMGWKVQREPERSEGSGANIPPTPEPFSFFWRQLERNFV